MEWGEWGLQGTCLLGSLALLNLENSQVPKARSFVVVVVSWFFWYLPSWSSCVFLPTHHFTGKYWAGQKVCSGMSGQTTMNFLANPIHLACSHLYPHLTPAKKKKKKKKKEACPFLPRNQTSRDYLVWVAPGFSELSFRLSAFCSLSSHSLRHSPQPHLILKTCTQYIYSQPPLPTQNWRPSWQ